MPPRCWGDAAEGLRAPSLQVGGLFRRTPDEPLDGCRPGRRDRDSAQAPLAKRLAGSAWSQPNRTPMAQKLKGAARRPRTFEAARRRALTRLRRGLDLQWTPPPLVTTFTTGA